MKLMVLYRKIIRKLISSSKITSQEFTDSLRKKGIEVGEGCRFFSPEETTIDTQNPWLLKIGKNVRITKGVIILTHDYSWAVLSKLDGEIFGSSQQVEIEDNVFIGVNAIILKGSQIGENSIIGAGSVVSGKLEPNSVYAGNPAKKIMSINEFHEKRKQKQIEEAKKIARLYFNKTGKIPSEEVLKEYFHLFTPSKKHLSREQIGQINRTGFGEYIMENINGFSAEFADFDEFLKECNLNQE